MLERALLWLPRAIYRGLRVFFLGIAHWIAGLPESIRSLFPDPSLERPEKLEPGEDLSKRIDRVQRALDAELTQSGGLNMRGTALAISSALAVLLLAQFSSVWLDNDAWSFSDSGRRGRADPSLSLAGVSVICLSCGRGVHPAATVGGDLKSLLRALNKGRARGGAASCSWRPRSSEPRTRGAAGAFAWSRFPFRSPSPRASARR